MDWIGMEWNGMDGESDELKEGRKEGRKEGTGRRRKENNNSNRKGLGNF